MLGFWKAFGNQTIMFGKPGFNFRGGPLSFLLFWKVGAIIKRDGGSQALGFEACGMKRGEARRRRFSGGNVACLKGWGPDVPEPSPVETELLALNGLQV